MANNRSAKETVINPLTGRIIEVGGKAYKSLVKNGTIVEDHPVKKVSEPTPRQKAAPVVKQAKQVKQVKQKEVVEQEVEQAETEEQVDQQEDEVEQLDEEEDEDDNSYFDNLIDNM